MLLVLYFRPHNIKLCNNKKKKKEKQHSNFAAERNRKFDQNIRVVISYENQQHSNMDPSWLYALDRYLKEPEYSVAYPEPFQTSSMVIFTNCFRLKLQVRCLAGFWIRLWYLSSKISEYN